MKSYLAYCDLEGWYNSLDYFERLRKKLFVMIQQLGLLMFFVEILWDLFNKMLHTLHFSKLNIPNKIEDRQFNHITKMI